MEWVTAARPKVDRCSTAWLIRRFVDPEAVFRFVATKKDAPGRGTPFDMPGAKHGHRGDMCTFETVVADYGLAGDAALRLIARIVNDLDFHKNERPESAGVQALLTGFLLSEPDDHKVLERAASLFDALYAYAKVQPAEGETKGGPIAPRPQRHIAPGGNPFEDPTNRGR